MPMKRQILLLSSLLLLSVSSMARTHIEPDNSSAVDSIKMNRFVPNHVLINDSVVNFGKIFLNTPYHYGSPGISSFDCSGFTSHVYRNFGYDLGRSSNDQSKQFDSVDRTQLKTGDLVFFSGSRRSKRVGHVGIVVSAKDNGEFDFIHAAVHSGVTISSSNETYYTKRYLKAGRVIGSSQMLAVSKSVPKGEKHTKDTVSLASASRTQTIKKTIPAEYHLVKSGETLSSISKKYGMTVADLKRKNSIKGNKLSLKQNLMIKDEETETIVQTVQPADNHSKTFAQNSNKTESLNLDQRIADNQTGNSHTVKKGETLFSISKIYNISIDELKNINKILRGKIHPGQELVISQPVNLAKNESSAKKQETPKAFTHKVISGESLYSIAKTNNVTVDELMRINNITNGKIHPGLELKFNQEKETRNNTSFASKTDKKQNGKTEIIEKEITHKIRRGENLGAIAKENNTTVDELKRINNLADSKIHEGQELKVIQNDESKNRNNLADRNDKKQELQNESKENTILHKIKRGENLGSIARNNNISVEELKRMNNLADSKIHEGQELKIVQNNESKTKNYLADRSNKKQDVQIENKETAITHKILKGESLGSIARKNNISVDELKRMNHLTDSKIKPGQELVFSQSLAVNVPKNKNVEIDSKSIQYKVKSGESFYTIAKSYGCTVEDLKVWNRKSGNKIKVGDKIIIFQKASKKDLSLVE